MGRSWGLRWRSWAAVGAYAGGLGSLLGPMLAGFGRLGAYVGGLGRSWSLSSRSWGLCWRSWVALGAYVGGPGPKNAKNMATLKMCVFLERERDLRPGGGILRRSWGLCWRSWVALGPSVGSLGRLLEPTLAILGRSWNLCWRSWDVLGPKRSVLGRSGRSWEGIRAEKWPKPEPEGRSGEGTPTHRFWCPERAVDFFL